MAPVVVALIQVMSLSSHIMAPAVVALIQVISLPSHIMESSPTLGSSSSSPYPGYFSVIPSHGINRALYLIALVVILPLVSLNYAHCSWSCCILCAPTHLWVIILFSYLLMIFFSNCLSSKFNYYVTFLSSLLC